MSVSYPPEVSFLSEPDKIRIHLITKRHLLFLGILLLHYYQCALRFHLPDTTGKKYRVSTFHAIANCEQLRSALYTGGAASQYGQLKDP